MAELTIDEAKAVYDLLVEECWPHNDPHGRASFIADVTRGGFREYRFCGSLGFGGKFWDSHHRWYVTTYREDETDERRATIERVNARLDDLYRHFKGEDPRWTS